MQVWNLLHTARWKHRMQKSRQKAPSGDHRTTSSTISSQLRHVSTIEIKLVKQQYLLWSPYEIGKTIIIFIRFFLSFFLSFFFFFFPRLISAVADWCGLSANLRCRSETCCTRLAENTGRKKVAKNRHLGTIAQLLSLIHIWRCRRIERCRSRWSPYH